MSDQGVVSICSTSTEDNLAAKKFIEEMNKDDVKASSTVAFEGPMPEVGAVFRDVEIKGKSLPFPPPPSLLPSFPPFHSMSTLAVGKTQTFRHVVAVLLPLLSVLLTLPSSKQASNLSESSSRFCPAFKGLCTCRSSTISAWCRWRRCINRGIGWMSSC